MNEKNKIKEVIVITGNITMYIIGAIALNFVSSFFYEYWKISVDKIDKKNITVYISAKNIYVTFSLIIFLMFLFFINF